jgi:hypothetical protein
MRDFHTVRLSDVIGETRAASFTEMMGDLETLSPQAQTPVEHDRLTFMRLLSVALVEGLREREPDGAPTAERVFELFGAACTVFGAYIAVNLADHWPADMPETHRAYLAQFLSENLGLGIATGLRQRPALSAQERG